MLDGLTVGAYASEPIALIDTPDLERAWYDRLQQLPGATGIETYYRDGLHPGGPLALGRLLPPQWHLVVTTIPHAVSRLTGDSEYGLASTRPASRSAAIDDVRRVHDDIRTLTETVARNPVRAVQVHSAPGGASAGVQAFTDSLREIAGWDWRGTAIVVEHCDAHVEDRPAAKGFLRLEDETRAVLSARADGTDTAIGQSVNWGRSAIEGRSAATPLTHVRQICAAGTAAGLMFSGAAATDGPLGGAWDDAHNPIDLADPHSLLSEAHIRDCLDAVTDAGIDLLFLGAKVQDPQRSADPDARLGPLRLTLDAIIRSVRGV